MTTKKKKVASALKTFNNKSKLWWQSRTIWLAVGQVVLGGLLALKAENPQLADGGIVATIIASIQIALRFDTSKAIK